VLGPALNQLRASAQRRILGAGHEIEDATGAVVPWPHAKATGRENGNALGRFVAIENEAGLSAFHRALAQLAAGTLPGGKLRILAYGASHTQGDVYPGYLRYYLQSRFGDGGRGFVQVAKLDKGYRTLDAQIESSGFSIRHAQRRAPDDPGRFGLLGASALATSPAAFAAVRQTSAQRARAGAVELAVYAMGEPGGGDLELFVDGSARARWATHRTRPEVVVKRVASPSGFSEVKVRPTGNGRVLLFGAAIERTSPGVVVDTLGISGTRAANWLRWDESSWAEQVKLRDPQLVTLAYGSNESTDTHQPIAHYERDLDRVLDRLRRAAPRASCLLIGPADVATKQRGVWTSRRRLRGVIAVQRRQAFAHGCAFFDAHSFMGRGGIARWHRASPRMAAADHVHLTTRGYVKLGMGLGDALMRAYDDTRRSSVLSA
jgi:lysophospholipase L1-like esterase